MTISISIKILQRIFLKQTISTTVDTQAPVTHRLGRPDLKYFLSACHFYLFDEFITE
jgi:hypothetical protein